VTALEASGALLLLLGAVGAIYGIVRKGDGRCALTCDSI
jgi:hypothetical protein